MGKIPAANRLLARLRRLRGQVRGPGEVLLMARVVVVAALVPAFVRLPLPRQSALLATRRKGRRPVGDEDVEAVVRVVELVQAVGRPLVRPGCLTRGITLYWFLGRPDPEIELCFGLGHVGASEDYSGHCWLTRGGQPFLERVDPTESFGVVYRIPASR